MYVTYEEVKQVEIVPSVVLFESIIMKGKISDIHSVFVNQDFQLPDIGIDPLVYHQWQNCHGYPFMFKPDNFFKNLFLLICMEPS